MELIHGSLLLSMVVYGAFGFCTVGGILGVLGTGYRTLQWHEEKKIGVITPHHIKNFKQEAITWAAYTVAFWGAAIAIDIYVL